jgi:hypothetical protein
MNILTLIVYIIVIEWQSRKIKAVTRLTIVHPITKIGLRVIENIPE